MHPRPRPPRALQFYRVSGNGLSAAPGGGHLIEALRASRPQGHGARAAPSARARARAPAVTRAHTRTGRRGGCELLSLAAGAAATGGAAAGRRGYAGKEGKAGLAPSPCSWPIREATHTQGAAGRSRPASVKGLSSGVQSPRGGVRSRCSCSRPSEPPSRPQATRATRPLRRPTPPSPPPHRHRRAPELPRRGGRPPQPLGAPRPRSARPALALAPPSPSPPSPRPHPRLTLALTLLGCLTPAAAGRAPPLRESSQRQARPSRCLRLAHTLPFLSHLSHEWNRSRPPSQRAHSRCSAPLRRCSASRHPPAFRLRPLGSSCTSRSACACSATSPARSTSQPPRAFRPVPTPVRAAHRGAASTSPGARLGGLGAAADLDRALTMGGPDRNPPSAPTSAEPRRTRRTPPPALRGSDGG